MSSGFLEATGFKENVEAAIAVGPLQRARRADAVVDARAPCPAGESLLELAFEAAGMLGPLLNHGRRTVKCPWVHLHTTGSTFDSSTILFPAIEGSDIGRFHCSHSHCSERSHEDVLDVLPEEAVTIANERVAARRATSTRRVGRNWAARQPSVPTSAMPPSVANTSTAPSDHNPTDVGNARRLVERDGANIRHCFPWKRWLAWTGTMWKVDERGGIERVAKETVAEFLMEAAARPPNDADRKALLAHGLKSEDARRIAAMVSLARSEPGVPVAPDELDTHDWLFNVENGTLDLRTAQLLPHQREHLLTKQAPVVFDPTARCQTWDAFLTTVLPNKPSVVWFIQKGLGYAMTGDTSAHVIFFFFGIGANGKTTLLETIARILGSYATQAAPNLLLEKKHDGHPTELADLFGKRMVVSSEVDQGRKLSEALVKQLTGGDRMKGRFVNKDFFEFRPTHKLFLAANHKPVIHGCDEGIWRRIRLVPFDVIIEKAKRDPGLMEKLWAERSGILNWLLEGCLAYQSEGLAAPDEVQSATDDYRSDMDRIAGFLADECVLAAGARGKAQDLFASYTRWCHINAQEPVSTKTFGSMLKEKGFRSAKMHGLSGWEGLRLKSDAERTAERSDTRGAVAGEDGERDPSPIPGANQSNDQDAHPLPPPPRFDRPANRPRLPD